MSYAADRFAVACEGLTPSEVTLVRTLTKRQSATPLRDRVAYLMRQPDAQGRFCSFPEIAVAFGAPAHKHSTFQYAYRRHLCAHPPPPMEDLSDVVRLSVSKAEEALACFTSDTDKSDALLDLLTCLRHFCTTRRLSFQHFLSRSLRCYDEEAR